MTDYSTEVRHLTYNAANQCFEALVVFHERGEQTSYPCGLPCAIDAAFGDVAQALVRQAQIKRSSGRSVMTAYRPARGAAARFDSHRTAAQILASRAQAA